MPTISHRWTQLDARSFERLADGAGFETKVPTNVNQRMPRAVKGGCFGNKIGRHLLLRPDGDTCSAEVRNDRMAMGFKLS